MEVCDLAKKKCVPCEGGVPPLKESEAKRLLEGLKGWKISGVQIEKELQFKDFVENMRFVNRVADIAEAEGHHPDLFIHYNKLKVVLWTHAVSGLTENDFIVAAKIDEINRT